MAESGDGDALRHEALQVGLVGKELRLEALHSDVLAAKQALVDACEGALAQMPYLRARLGWFETSLPQ